MKTAMEEFASRLYAESIKSASKHENFAISPLSVYLALGVTQSWANGETARQIRLALGFPPDSAGRPIASIVGRLTAPALDSANNTWTRLKEGQTLASASGFFAKKEPAFDTSFVRQVRDSLGFTAKNMQFNGQTGKSRRKINQWAKERTYGYVADLLDSQIPTDQTQLLLIDTIWFNGDWAWAFEKTRTKRRPFTVEGKGQKLIPTMHSTSRLRTLKTARYRAISIPYAGEKLSMIIMVPTAGVKLESLDPLLKDSSIVQEINQRAPERVSLALPRLRIETRKPIPLSKTLEKMGMVDAFSQGEADFSPMTKGTSSLHLDEFLHKAVIIVSEEGSSSSTKKLATPTPPTPDKPIEFRVDQSFLFFVYHEPSQAVLFAGRVIDPEIEK